MSIALAICTLAFSLALLAVSLLSWARLRHAKLLIAGGAFAVLALKGALSTYRTIFLKEADLVPLALDFGVLGFLYLSVAVR